MLRVTCVALAGAMAATAVAQQRPAEEDRFDTAAFQNALRARGLTELLELHLNEFPPRNEESLILLQRQVRLSRYADATLSEAERLAALAEANRLLEQLIRMRDTDPRRHEWRCVLAQSLLNEEAAPAIARIILLGGNADDRRVLADRAGRAVALLEKVVSDVDSEYARLDAMNLRDYERVEESGYIDRLETADAQARYLIIWAAFYDALPRAPRDTLRHQRLESVLDRLEEEAWLLEKPHDETHLQAQTLLLAGMAERLMGLDDAAERHLDEAVRAVQKISDPAEQKSLEWVTLRAVVERARALHHAGRGGAAAEVLDDFERKTAAGEESFGHRLVIAMARRALHKSAAAQARADKEPVRAAQEQAAATAELVRLAEGHAGHRDEIYGTLYDLMGADADLTSLDDIEKAALMAGLLRDARRMEDSAGAWPPPDGPPHPGGATPEALRRRVLQIGASMPPGGPAVHASLEPEIAFNLAVAYQQLGDSVEAARQFLRVGREYPRFPDALRASLLAVQLAYQLRAAPQSDPAAGELYLDALAALVTRHGASPEARYWRFFYALALEDAGRYADAAAQYLLVEPLHEHALEAMCFRARSLGAALLHASQTNGSDAVSMRRGVAEILDLLRDFNARAAELKSTAAPDRVREIDAMMAEAALVQARIQLLPMVGNPQRALEILAQFETTWPDAKRPMGAVLATRLTALQRLGRFDDAAALLPGYVAIDPAGAGATLQSLYTPLAEALEKESVDGAAEGAEMRSELARRIAEQLCIWAQQPQSHVDEAGLRALKLQLGEALVRAGEPAQARQVFLECGARSAAAAPSGAGVDARAVMGLAESHYVSGEFDAALPLYNKIATTLSPQFPMRWKALLRDLQCRKELGHDPAGIAKVIQNQQVDRHYADPAAGGRYVSAFEALLKASQRREP